MKTTKQRSGSGFGNRARALLVGLATLACSLLAAPVASAEFGIVEFNTAASSPQAAGHADIQNNIKFTVNEDAPQGPGKADGHARRIEVDLPYGLVGDPSAAPTCSHDQFSAHACPAETQVGVVDLWLNGPFPPVPGNGVFNLTPGDNEPALLGVVLSGALKSFIRVSVRPDGRLRATVDDLPFGAAVMESRMTLWGVPADHNGGTYPRRPFMAMPTNCEVAPNSNLRAIPYEDPAIRSATFSEPNPNSCDLVPFDPSITAAATNPRPGQPTGLEFELDLPYDQHPDRLVTAHLKDASVTLPEGMAINPSAADGLSACTDAQFGKDTTADPNCPLGSRIGTVSIASPIARVPLTGDVYLGEQKPADPYRMLLVVQGIGVTIKLEGSIKPDPDTGRLTTTFDDNPQLPFTKLSLDLKDGPRAPLVTPPACGTYSTQFEFSSWSGHEVKGSSSMAIDQGCGPRPFSFGFQAGTTNPLAGASSAFTMLLSRGDDTQEFSGIDVDLPPGLLANVGSVPRCAAAAADAGTCGPASKVGSVNVSAGAGSAPFWAPAPGKAPTAAYLAGPYRGAPYSLSVVVPAQAGPFDLGRVVARVALAVDRTDLRVSAPLVESRIYGTDDALVKVIPGGLPRILMGIPLNVRDINLAIDRAGFIRNPTNCEPKQVNVQLASQQGAMGSASDRFQVGDCASLGFGPKLRLWLSGGMKRSGNPALKAVLTQPSGQANIDAVSVKLPTSQFIDNEHINNPCTRAQFAANACPPASILGTATAYSPLLDEPLSGHVYFRANGGERELPDIVAALRGAISVDLVGFVDSVKVKGTNKSRVRNRFLLVPDAPVSRFEIKLKGGKLGLLENSQNLCSRPQRVTIQMDGQNGRVHDTVPALGTSCGSKAKQRR